MEPSPQLRWILIFVCGAGASTLATMALAKSSAPAAPAAAPQPPAMDPVLRELLKRQMSKHAMAAADTWWNAIDLRYDAARASAQELVESPVLAAGAPADSLNAQLPPRFYELQEKMRSAARAVSAAAIQRDAHALGATTGKLTESCIACHAEFRP